jgi:membrane protein implicated in regulation of membrane protease activity
VVLAFFALISIFLPWPWSLVVLLAGIAGEMGAIVWGRRLAQRPSATGIGAMIGARARVVEECRPQGRVRLGGELWDAVCPSGAGVNDSVIVVGGNELTLQVAAGGAAPRSSQREDARSG